MTFKKHLKLNKSMKERGQSRVRPLPSHTDKPHYKEDNSVHHYMLGKVRISGEILLG